MEAYLEREAKLQRGLDTAHWLRHNLEHYRHFSLRAYAQHRVAAFSAGARKSLKLLLAEIESRLAMRYG
jgi:hypothetical protein